MNTALQSTDRFEPNKTGILLSKLTVTEWQRITEIYDQIVGGAATFYLCRSIEDGQRNLERLNATLNQSGNADFRVGSRLTTHSKLFVALENAANPRVKNLVVTFSFSANLDPKDRPKYREETDQLAANFRQAIMDYLKAERLAVAVR